MEIEQSGVVPYRRVDGEVQVLVISSRHFDQWHIPKGLVESDLSAAESAVQEAFEEAGIKGRVDDEPIGEYTYEKWNNTYRVTVFPFEVEQELDDWPEAGERTRKWLSLDDAVAIVEPDGLKPIIQSVTDRVE